MAKPKTQRVRILVSLGGEDELGSYSYGGGEEDVPAARAAQLIKAGHAEAVGGRKPAARPASTKRPAGKTSRRRKAS